jgi:hypothetical protein
MIGNGKRTDLRLVYYFDVVFVVVVVVVVGTSFPEDYMRGTSFILGTDGRGTSTVSWQKEPSIFDPVQPQPMCRHLLLFEPSEAGKRAG